MIKNVLIVEDDRKTAHLIELYLQKDGYRVAIADDGRAGLEMARRLKPDLVILDLMLPGLDGVQVCRQLRTESTVPIIMLTARTTEDDKLLGLDMGADDYVTKPFSPRELVARVRAVLRRTDQEGEDLEDITYGDLTLSLRRHEVTKAGKPINLTPTEFDLLRLLIRHPSRAFTRLQIVDHVLGLDYRGFERTIDVHVTNLRRKIERDPSHPSYVKTVYGVGYKFEASGDVS
ncbi:MAG: response regulator transcription factor [Dehalococcoidales bacterium]|nr:response regulator transcription factor [Dehalococcoidales bacterium]